MRVFRDFWRHIRNGFRNLFRNGWMTTATILTMVLTLFMVGSLMVFMDNVDNVIKDIEQGVKIRVHIDIAATKEEEATLKEQILAIDHVDKVTYRTKDEELADVVENYGSEFELFEGDANPFYNVYVVDVDSTDVLDQVSQAISQLPNAAEVKYGAIDTKNLLKTIEIIRMVLALLAAILVVVAISLVSNTIKMTINARQTEIQIMRLVGANNSYIRSPFAYEGMFIGLLGGLLASLILYGAYEGLQRASIEIIGVRIIRFSPSWPLLLYVGAVLVLAGMVFGVMGARRSIRQYLKQ